MIRHIFLILTFVVLATSSVHAQIEAKVVKKQKKSFALNREVTVIANKWESVTAQDIAGILESNNTPVKIVRKNILVFSPKIVIEKVHSIEGCNGPDGLSIEVGKRKVIVRYTSERSREEAIGYFEELVSDGYIQGYIIKNWDDGTRYERFKADEDVVDAATNFIQLEELGNMMEQERSKGKKTIYLQVVNSRRWRVESSVFTTINPLKSIYPSDRNYYKSSELSRWMKDQAKKGTKVIPMIDLLKPNTPFEEVSGHSQFSVEGMRFVRGVIEEYAAAFPGQPLCIGTKSPGSDNRYLDFLKFIEPLCGVELIIK